MRRFIGVVMSTGVVLGVGIATTGAQAGAAPRPVAPAEHKARLHAPTAAAELRVSPADAAEVGPRVGARPGSVRVVSASEEVRAGDTPLVVGMTWGSAQDDLVVQYRTRTAPDAAWSAWEDTTHDDGHGPDPGTKEAAHQRSGSDPVAVGSGTSVQVRALGLAGRTVPGLSMDVIDPGQSPADATVGTATPGSAGAVATRPVIYTRAQWGADESLRNGGPDYAGVQAAVVHHTVNSNTYRSSDVPALIRGIYAFHVKSRGWSDIGYNFLIDRFGRIWEGRYGGTTRAVVGAQAKGANSWSFGAATIGDFSASAVPSAVVSAYTRLVAWKAQIHQFDPAKPANIAGTVKRGVNGHRDINQTGCPGDYLYRYVPTIAAGASPSVRSLPSLTVDRDVDNNGDNDVIATNARNDLLLYHAEGSQMQPARTISSGGWVGVDLTVNVGDWNGDRAPDVIARMASTGRLRLYAGNGTGGLRSGVDIGTGWQTMRTIVGVGDLDRDGANDLVAVDAVGALRLYPGNGRGGFRTPVVIGSGWQNIRLVVGVGDWTGDGRPDILGVTNTGAALVYKGTGTGRVSGSVSLGTGWDRWRSVTAVGDATNDTRVDVLAVDGSGAASIIASTATAGVVRTVGQTRSFAGVEAFSG